MNSVKKVRYIRWTLFIIIFSIVCIYFYYNNPAVKPYPPCPFLYFTGHFCPGCGTSRAFHQILHGNILYALDLNPLMVVCIPFIIYLLICFLEPEVKEKCIVSRLVFNSFFLKMMLGVIFIYWIARNIEIYPFILLAP